MDNSPLIVNQLVNYHFCQLSSWLTIFYSYRLERISFLIKNLKGAVQMFFFIVSQLVNYFPETW